MLFISAITRLKEVHVQILALTKSILSNKIEMILEASRVFSEIMDTDKII